MDLVDFEGAEVDVAALEAHEVESKEEGEKDKGKGGRPVNKGVAKEEVFDDYGNCQ